MPKYTGDGFDKGPFSEEERAAMREMRRDIEDAMVDPDSIRDMLKGWERAAPIISFLASTKESATGLAVIFGVVSALCIGVVWMIKQGWFA